MAGYKVKIQLVSDTVRPHLAGLTKGIKGAIGIAMARIGTEAQEKSRSMSPYKSGTLRRGIQYEAKPMSTEFGVNKAIIPYARIREFGGVIRPKTKPFLAFKIDGKWVRTKKVVQRGANGGRGYLRPTFDHLKSGRASSIIDEEIKYYLDKTT